MYTKPTNYDDYLTMSFKNVQTDSYGRITSCGNISVSDTCKVVADWCPEIKRYKCRVLTLQKHGNSIFAYVKWLGAGTDLIKKYGSLWSIDELVKV